jgi:glycosyltransferase involved in cell wall biosynthesis
VTVVTPLLPTGDGLPAGFNAETNPPIARLLAPFFRERGVPAGGAAGAIAWYSTPMALGAEPAGFDPALVVYDAMDELANFWGAPPTLREREAALLARADLVFTGGPSLYARHRGRHPRLFCFPSGVEADHFAPAADGLVRPPDLAACRRPILGFYGVLDERIDFDLVAAIADLRPDWTLALIGPVAKIDPGELPRRPNIRYVGRRDYAALPGYLACFDVAILPFARNAATRFISPTKTLEYLAAGKPVASTPIQDVVDLYGDAVAFAATPERFVVAAASLLAEPEARRRQRLAASRRLVAEHGWDGIAARMRGLIGEALGDGAAAVAAAAVAAPIVPYAEAVFPSDPAAAVAD